MTPPALSTNSQAPSGVRAARSTQWAITHLARKARAFAGRGQGRGQGRPEPPRRDLGQGLGWPVAPQRRQQQSRIAPLGRIGIEPAHDRLQGVHGHTGGAQATDQ